MARDPLRHLRALRRHAPRRRHPWWAGAAVLAVLLAVAYFGVAWIIVNQALVTKVEPLETTPASMGLPYEDVAFEPRGWEDLTLRGWWMPQLQDPQGTLVWVHGLDSNRESRLELVRDLHREGFSILVFDLRGHGESDKAQMGAGLHEQDDVLGAMDFLVAERGVAPGALGVMGLSFGGAIALMAAAGEPAIGGVVADSAFASLTDLMVQETADRTVLPRWAAQALMPGLVLVSRWTKGIDISAVRPEEAIREIGYPVLLIHGSADDRIPPEHAKRLFSGTRPGTVLTIAQGVEHAKAYEMRGPAYVEQVALYLRERLGQ